MKSSIEQHVTTASTEAGGEAKKSTRGGAAQSPSPKETPSPAAESRRKSRSVERPYPSSPIEDEVTGGSKQQYGAMESQWADPTVKSRGRQERRSGLPREPQVITRHEVDEQIRQFFLQQ